MALQHSALSTQNSELRTSLRHHPQRGWQDVQTLAMNRKHLAIDHHVDRTVEVEVYPLGLAPRSLRLLNVRSAVQPRQVGHQFGAADRPPSHVLYQSVRRV